MDFSKILQRWNLLSGIATAICTCVGGFLVLPVISQDSSSWVKFGVFAVTVLVGLELVPMQLYTSAKAMRFWLAGAIVCFFAAIGAYVGYSRALDRWTFDYQGQPVVAGAHLSLKAAAFREEGEKQGRAVTDHDLLWWAGGNIADVWPTQKERTDRVSAIFGLYLATLLLLSSTVVTVVQATYCTNANPPQDRT